MFGASFVDNAHPYWQSIASDRQILKLNFVPFGAKHCKSQYQKISTQFCRVGDSVVFVVPGNDQVIHVYQEFEEDDRKLRFKEVPNTSLFPEFGMIHHKYVGGCGLLN